MILHHGWFGGGWGIIAGLGSLAFFLLIVSVVVALLRGRPGTPAPRASPALRLLEERYARGEIDRDEFLERRDVLLAGDEART